MRSGLAVMFFSAAAAVAAANYLPPSMDEYRRAIRSYPFVKDAARTEKIRVAIPKLRHCMSGEEIRRLMGDPDFGSVSENASTMPPTPAGFTWYYVIADRADDDDLDSYMTLWLDGQQRLNLVTMWGLRDMPESSIRKNRECDQTGVSAA